MYRNYYAFTLVLSNLRATRILILSAMITRGKNLLTLDIVPVRATYVVILAIRYRDFVIKAFKIANIRD